MKPPTRGANAWNLLLGRVGGVALAAMVAQGVLLLCWAVAAVWADLRYGRGPQYYEPERIMHYPVAFAVPLALALVGSLAAPAGARRGTGFALAGLWGFLVYSGLTRRAAPTLGDPSFDDLIAPGAGWQGVASAALGLAGAALALWVVRRVERGGERAGKGRAE